MISSRQITTYFLGTTACVSIVSNIVRNTLLAYLHGTKHLPLNGCTPVGAAKFILPVRY